MFWRGRNLLLIGDSAGKTYKGDPVNKERVLRDWEIQEGDGAW